MAATKFTVVCKKIIAGVYDVRAKQNVGGGVEVITDLKRLNECNGFEVPIAEAERVAKALDNKNIDKVAQGMMNAFARTHSLHLSQVTEFKNRATGALVAYQARPVAVGIETEGDIVLE